MMVGETKQSEPEFVVSIILFIYYSLVALTIYTSLNYRASEPVAVRRFFAVSSLFGAYFFVVFWAMAYGIINLFITYVPEGEVFKDEEEENPIEYTLPNL